MSSIHFACCLYSYFLFLDNERKKAQLIEQVRVELKLAFDQELMEQRRKVMKQIRAEVEKEMKSKHPKHAVVEESESKSKFADLEKLEFKRPKQDGSSQTEVDDHGIWDKQDGWTLPISGTVLARQQWRRAIMFAKCPSCRGIGQFVGVTAKLLKMMLRGQSVAAQHDVDLKRRAAKWSVPDELVSRIAFFLLAFVRYLHIAFFPLAFVRYLHFISCR